MALVKNPLFSLSTTGSLGHKLAYQATLNGPRVCRITRPTGIASQAQIDTRVLMTCLARSWSNVFRMSQIRQAWKFYADRMGRNELAQSVFFRSAFSQAKIQADAGYVSDAWDDSGIPTFDVSNVVTGNTSEEPGAFSIYRGTSPQTLAWLCDSLIVFGSIIGSAVPAAGTYFYAVRKNGVSRSGYIKLTQIVPAIRPDIQAAWDAYFTDSRIRTSWAVYGSLLSPAVSDLEAFQISILADEAGAADHAFVTSFSLFGQWYFFARDWRTGEILASLPAATCLAGNDPSALASIGALSDYFHMAWRISAPSPTKQYGQVVAGGIARSGIIDTTG